MSKVAYDPPLPHQVGFDYAGTVRELLTRFTYSEIAERCGYKSVGSLYAVMEGRVPSHVHGESIWALYKDTFGRKPPHPFKKTQAI